MTRRIVITVLLLLAAPWLSKQAVSASAQASSSAPPSELRAPSEHAIWPATTTSQVPLAAAMDSGGMSHSLRPLPNPPAFLDRDTVCCTGTRAALRARDPAYWLPILAGKGTLISSGPETLDVAKNHAVFQRLNDQPADLWLGWDKVQHVTFSFLFTLGSQYTLVNKMGVGEHTALPVSMTVSGAVGLAKEINDRYRGPTRYFSKRDLVADAAGILAAAGLILL